MANVSHVINLLGRDVKVSNAGSTMNVLQKLVLVVSACLVMPIMWVHTAMV